MSGKRQPGDGAVSVTDEIEEILRSAAADEDATPRSSTPLAGHTSSSR